MVVFLPKKFKVLRIDKIAGVLVYNSRHLGMSLWMKLLAEKAFYNSMYLLLLEQ